MRMIREIPQSWYFVCRARDLPAGGINTWTLGTRSIVVYRPASGRVVAMDARCPHMGAHLGRGRVVGEDLQCALHHWQCGSAGDCRPPDGPHALRQTTYPVVEKHGSVFVFAGVQPRFEIPDLVDGGDARVASGRPVLVRTSWAAVAMNAFDISHMDAVHHRSLRQEPQVALIGSACLELKYVSRVTGAGLSDRFMRLIADDRIDATIQCWGGTLIVVQSRAGTLVSRLLLCLTPAEGGVVVTPIVARPRGNVFIDTIVLRMTRWLFTAFLKRDVEPLAGMDLRIEGALASPGPLAWAARWLATLPGLETPDDWRASNVQISTRGAVEDTTTLRKIEV
jgi:nitrite reductase/ring-hydroxylating ferredoxin subunit